jgi:Tfp pilus assembly protein PilN
MIKINLANRKKTQFAISAVEDAPLGQASTPSAFGSGGFDQIKSFPWIKLVGSLAVMAVAFYGLNYYQEQKLQELQTKFDEVQSKVLTSTSQLKKYEGYEAKKAQLDADETMLTNKIKIIQKLMSDRDQGALVLEAISKAMPKETWLTELNSKDGLINFKGNTKDFGQMTDFMKALEETVYFKDLQTKTSQATKLDTGAEVVQFEVEASRK